MLTGRRLLKSPEWPLGALLYAGRPLGAERRLLIGGVLTNAPPGIYSLVPPRCGGGWLEVNVSLVATRMGPHA